MKVERINVKSSDEYSKIENIQIKPDLIFVFGAREILNSSQFTDRLKSVFPNSLLFGCSTSGEISGIEVFENSASITAIQFDKTLVKLESVMLSDCDSSFDCGAEVAKLFATDNLRHVMVLSDGIHINGARLIDGMQSILPKSVAITGGLAGDGISFAETCVYDKNGEAKSKCISCIGFYGDSLTIGYGSNGGWESFGVERLVTKSEGNVLYEVDNQPILELYKEFLGNRAEQLPASGLLFPLNLREEKAENALVRTILGINEEDNSMTFAGGIPEGSYVRLMKSDVDRLIAGAEFSAKSSAEMMPETKSELAVLISCVGRRLVLKQLVEEEVEAVAEVLGQESVLTGFYSYGEISPFKEGSSCFLHNQTMTITTFSEK